MYQNSQILAAVVNHWAQPFIATITTSKLQGNAMFQTIENSIKKYLPVSPNYSLGSEMGWIVPKLTSGMIEPMLMQQFGKAPNESLPKMAHDIVDGMAEKAAQDGSVTIAEILIVEEADIKELKRLLTLNMPIVESETYQIKM